MSNRPKLVHSDPSILSGTPVFVGTRVPVGNLFDCLEAGETIDDFLKSFPSVSRDQAIAALEIARKALEELADETLVEHRAGRTQPVKPGKR